MAEKRVPVRTCVGCRKEFGKKELLRIVRTKDGEVFIDRTGKANGRGAYICGEAQCLAKIKKTKAFDRAFGVAVPQEIYASIEEAILGKRE